MNHLPGSILLQIVCPLCVMFPFTIQSRLPKEPEALESDPPPVP